MAFSFRKKLGEWGEQQACLEYLKQGYVLVARNIYNHKGKRMGEIDLIMRSETKLIFVEVKTRSSNRFGSGLEAVGKEKQRKLLRVIAWFKKVFPQYKHLRPQIDVCVIEPHPFNLDNTPKNVIIMADAVTLDY